MSRCVDIIYTKTKCKYAYGKALDNCNSSVRISTRNIGKI